MDTLLLLLLFNQATYTFDLPENLLKSVCYVESNHNINAINYNDGHGHSMGVCQIKYKTAKWLGFKGTENQLMRPEVNIYYAAKYLRKNLDRYGGDVKKALIAYNRGNAKGLTRTKYSDKVLKLVIAANN